MFPIYDLIRVDMPSPSSHSWRTVYTFPCDAMVFARIKGGGKPSVRVVFGSVVYKEINYLSGIDKIMWVYVPQGGVLQRAEGSGGGTGNAEAVVYLINPYSKNQSVSTNGSGV